MLEEIEKVHKKLESAPKFDIYRCKQMKHVFELKAKISFKQKKLHKMENNFKDMVKVIEQQREKDYF